MMNSEEYNQIDQIIQLARNAQQQYEAEGSQQLFDMACKAVAWALMKPEHNQLLAGVAVAATSLGNADDKIAKNHNKTLGLLGDIEGVKSFGHISDDIEKGLSTYYRPKGVVAAIIPSTNPLATPTNNIINALKTGNAIIIAPSPKAVKPLQMLLGYIHSALKPLNIPEHLVQMVPTPPCKVKTQRLMQQSDLVVVTGSPSNVRAGYESGTPALGVGIGNVVSIIDESADIASATAKIAASKTFDNATSCSSENTIIAVDKVYDEVIANLQRQAGFVLNQQQTQLFIETHWQHGKLTNQLLAKDIDVILNILDLTDIAPDKTQFLVIPQQVISADNPLIGEKMTRAVTLYRAADFEDAAQKAIAIQSYQGAGHSISLHSTVDNHAHYLAMRAPTCRVIVNQAHCFAAGGFFTNGLAFSLSIGCGSWGGNSIDDNLNWQHFVNKVRIVREIPEQKPSLNAIFSNYWQQYGQ